MINAANKAEETSLKNQEAGFGAAASDSTTTPTPTLTELAPPQDGTDFPEGGWRAWSVVLGSFCAMFSVFGIINTTAVFQEYLGSHQLRDYTPAQTGWIFSLSLFITFFGGAFIGPIFDAYGPRLLVLSGSTLLTLSMFLLGLCSKYWHFLLCYGVLNGIGGAVLNPPALAAIGHFFLVKRGHATGVAMASGGIGGVVFPLILERLLVSVGFAWATRVLGFIILFCVILANLLIRSRLPTRQLTGILPDFRVFKDAKLTLITLSTFLMECGLFVPLAYISSFGVAHGQTPGFGAKALVILNAGSVCGRLFSGWVSDRVGRFNTLIVTIILCAVTILALWLPTNNSKGLLLAFSFFFGITSGSNLSLSPVCVGQLCHTEHYGRYYATSYMMVSFGTLLGLPIAGQILTAAHGNYNGLIIFCGTLYVAAGVCVICARGLAVGWRIKVVF